MVLEVEVDAQRVREVEKFFSDPAYKDYLEQATAFNRKLNEERKMRIPYIDSQTGVAQRHYDLQRSARERMPPKRVGQILAYPEKQWRKKRYQYLKFFMNSSRSRFDPEAEMHTISQIENPTLGTNEESNQSIPKSAGDENSKPEWYYEEDFEGEGGEDFNSDSDFEYEDYGSKKKKGKGGKSKGKSSSSMGQSSLQFSPKETKVPQKNVQAMKSGTPSKRRTHADNIPDSEKPFSCELCGARYKTRPGLTYHYKNSHKDFDRSTLNIQPSNMAPSQAQPGGILPPHHHSGGGAPPPMMMDDNAMHHDDPGVPTFTTLGAPPTPMSGGNSGLMSLERGSNSSLTPPSTPGGGGMGGGDLSMDGSGSSRQSTSRRAATSFRDTPGSGDIYSGGSMTQIIPPPPEHMGGPPKILKTMSGKDRAPSLGYCDFCLGDAAENKKTSTPEELVSCAECGRSGHPTCLQFSPNMLVSVKEYPWQCIECKCCTLCGTSENDDQLLFCDDCDRGYHMYCLVPPIKEPPEGSWSCKLCLERFHRK